MYKRILVALDGSDTAERILPHAEGLAKGLSARLILLRATTPAEAITPAAAAGPTPVSGPLVDTTELLEAEVREASTYLSVLVDRLRARGISAEYVQQEGPPAEVIRDQARARGVDLIAMTSHGRGGLSRLVFGSVANAVLSQAPCPLLLLRVRQS